VLSVGVVDVELSRMARALSARCVSRVDGTPIRTLSTGETFRLLRGTRTVSVGDGVVVIDAFDESVFIPDMFDESVFIPDMFDESVVVLVLGGVVVGVPVGGALSVC
jgi:hypothetical protein